MYIYMQREQQRKDSREEKYLSINRAIENTFGVPKLNSLLGHIQTDREWGGGYFWNFKL